MFLVLDPEHLRIGLSPQRGGEVAWRQMTGKKPDWVAEIGAFCEESGVMLADIKACSVLPGKAGFSDARSAVLIGNLLSWLRPGVKLYAGEQEVNELKPDYFAEPNITTPKS